MLNIFQFQEEDTEASLYGDFNPNLYRGGGANLPPRQFFCRSSKTVGARLLKLSDFYC